MIREDDYSANKTNHVGKEHCSLPEVKSFPDAYCNDSNGGSICQKEKEIGEN